MYLLLFGVPGEGFINFLREHYPPGDWELIIAESRPYEEETVRAINVYGELGYQVTVISDNMIMYTLQQKSVDGVFIFYQQYNKPQLCCRGGSLLAALMSSEAGIPCFAYPAGMLPETDEGRDAFLYAGIDISIPGIVTDIQAQDMVAESYIKQIYT